MHPPTFDEIYETCAADVWRLVRRLGVRVADVPDVCQEVFLTVHRKLSGFEGRASARTWVYAIALRCASAYRRRAHVVRETPVAEPAADQATEPGQQAAIERSRARALLDGLLDQLDENQRVVFVLYELHELPMAEIAEIAGCPVQTAYSRLHAARRIVSTIAMERAS